MASPHVLSFFTVCHWVGREHPDSWCLKDNFQTLRSMTSLFYHSRLLVAVGTNPLGSDPTLTQKSIKEFGVLDITTHLVSHPRDASGPLLQVTLAWAERLHAYLV